MGIVIWIVSFIAVLAFVGMVYVLFFALPKIGKGMQETGAGLQDLGQRFQDFANFMAQKLG